MTPVLLTGGIGGAIAALASQSFLANIVSGINLVRGRSQRHHMWSTLGLTATVVV